MRSSFSIASVALLGLFTPAASADVKLIIDTDAGFDVDDVGALAVAHHLQDLGQVDIIGTIYPSFFKEVIEA